MDIEAETAIIVSDMLANGEIGPDGDFATVEDAIASTRLWLEQNDSARHGDVREWDSGRHE